MPKMFIIFKNNENTPLIRFLQNLEKTYLYSLLVE